MKSYVDTKVFGVGASKNRIFDLGYSCREMGSGLIRISSEGQKSFFFEKFSGELRNVNPLSQFSARIQKDRKWNLETEVSEVTLLLLR